MGSLRETKDRIGSVKSTLKITSAMKLVASAKLRKAQSAITAMRPYQQTLSEILGAIPRSVIRASLNDAAPGGKTALVAVASNSSLCGAFNTNILHAAREVLSAHPDADVFAVGRKAADALRRLGYASDADYGELIGRPSYEPAAALAEKLVGRFNEGVYARVILVYNHFVSTATQKVVVEDFLPYVLPAGEAVTDPDEYIYEPSAEEIAATLLPQVFRLKLYTVLLDSAAAEHAARTVAMQTATDNAEGILSDLTLEYNKRRQQKITSEILDIVGGMQEG